MDKTFSRPVPRNSFFAWLDEGDGALQSIGKSGSSTTFLKLPHTEDAEYIFSASECAGTGINWDMKFEFCGMYFPQTRTLRLADLDLSHCVSGLNPEEMFSQEHWISEISQRVNERIEQKIGDDCSRLTIRELSDENMINRLDDFTAYEAERRAADMFLDKEPLDFRFHSAYSLYGVSESRRENALAAYFHEPDKFLESEAQKYIETQQENILYTFLQNDALRSAYEALEQDTGSDLYRCREITRAIRLCGAKTVSVTVNMDGKELTFKADAQNIARSRGRYSEYDIASSDRVQYQQLFGRYTDYTSRDISRVTYGRKVLYEVPQEQKEEAGFEMEMG